MKAYIIGLIVWNFIGGVINLLWVCDSLGNGWEWCNPYWAYQYNRKVNWFGACMLSLLFNLLCPIGAVCYWFYKLCTVGRK